MKISETVLQVIDRSATDGSHLVLPEQLDRKMYVEVNKVIVAAGGKWNRSAKAHVFDGQAAEAVEQLLMTGEVTTRQEIEFFPTPPAVVEKLLWLGTAEPGLSVLEPSAGQGAIAGPLAGRGLVVDCIEQEAANAKVIEEAGYARKVVTANFLHCRPNEWPDSYDRVIMNPPFASQADIKHVMHALEFLRPDGWLVSVMSAGTEFRENKAAVAFRDHVKDRGGWIERLPDDSFKASGTTVRTVIAVIPAGGEK